jgi:hypothetical protein
VPEKKTVRRARKKKHEGKASSTQAGEFVREEMHDTRKGKHGAVQRNKPWQSACRRRGERA